MRDDKFEELKNLERIVQRIDRDAEAVVVEGFSDRKALRNLGFTGRIFESAERNLELLAEDIGRSTETVAILTDFDSHGKEQNNRLRHLLQEDADVLVSAREQFGSQLTSEGRMAVEDVRPLFEDKEQKFVDAALDQLYLDL